MTDRSDALLRAVVPDDLPRLTALNNAAAPAVPVEDEASLARLVGLSALALVAQDGAGEPIGFVLAMAPGLDYESENYRWFSARGDAFAYVDRIVLAEQARGRGLGRQLYEAVVAWAVEDERTEVDCEVNLDPPNPASLAFHERLGFARVGEQATKGGAVRVALLALPIGAGTAGTAGRAGGLDRR